jgi:hypothetical protein
MGFPECGGLFVACKWRDLLGAVYRDEVCLFLVVLVGALGIVVHRLLRIDPAVSA